MAKSSSTDLHELIYSLNTGEIVYFKKYAKRYCEKDSVYLTLFDNIKAVEEDLPPIDNCTKNIFAKQRFAEHKWYLYNLILESLTAYHKHNRLDFQVIDMISKAIILMNKKLFVQALKTIEHAKEIIQKNNIDYAINEVLALEGTIKMEIFREPNIINYFKNLFETYRTNTQSQNNLSNMLEVRYIVKSLYCKYGILSHIVDKETLDYCHAKFNAINRDSLNPMEQIIYDNNAVNLYAYGKAEKPYHILFTRLKNLYENNPSFIQQHTHNYLYMLCNSITRYIVFNNDVETQRNLQALKDLNKTTGIFSERYFKTLITIDIFYYEQVLLLKQKNIVAAYHNLKEISDFTVADIKTLPVRIQLKNYYLFALICFYNNKFEECLDWLHKVFDESNTALDLQLLGRMYEIACHTELCNNLLVKHKVVALNRFCKKQLSSILQINIFIKLIKLFLQPIVTYKNAKLQNHIEASLIDLCKKERIDKFGFDIVIYCIMKNNKLNYSDAFDYYNCEISIKKEMVLN
jgi:hypothetical protein